MSSQSSPSPNKQRKRIRGKPLKRLNPTRNFNPNFPRRQSTRHVTASTSRQVKDYRNELSEFISLRDRAQASTSTSIGRTVSAIPSQELIWIRDESEPQPLSPILEVPQTIICDDEIEDGEIVDSEVTEIVNNLLEESYPMLERSRKVIDINSSREDIFFEDRSPTTSGTVPKYNTFGQDNNGKSKKMKSSGSDDVICLDTSLTDDSVIFVSEEKSNDQTVNHTPLLSNLCNSVPVTSPFIQPHPSPLRKSPRKRMRTILWKQKKKIEYAEINAANGKKDKAVEPKPSTSGENLLKKLDAAGTKTEKRIVLLDGSNIAMGFTDNYGAKKTDKDFSAEGNLELRHFIAQN